MADELKRYYWLKLKDDFFRQKEIKQLRKVAGGDVFIIIYLKMLLRSLKDDGKLYYEGVDTDFVSELALDIDEDVENVKITVTFLMSKGILVQCSEDEYSLLTAKEMTGSECYSAERVRRFRKNQQQLALQSNNAVTACNEEKRDKREERRDNTISRKSAESEIPSGFTEFYSLYPRKVSKAMAIKAWERLNPDDSLLDTILADVRRRVNGEWAGKELQYVPHPSTYLNQRRWEDETATTDRVEAEEEHDLPLEEILRRGDDCSVPEGFTPCGGW
jgi:predicted phage replisome organizer